MKYLLILLLGISIGIGGELLIPVSKRYGQTSGCLDVGNNRFFMPEGYFYEPTKYKYPAHIVLYNGIIPSYRYLYALLTGEVKIVQKEQCEKILDLISKTHGQGNL